MTIHNEDNILKTLIISDATKKTDEMAEWVEWGVWKKAPIVDPRFHGGHGYTYEGTSDCKFGCGCFMGESSSGGPVDPFGSCPKNPYNNNVMELTTLSLAQAILEIDSLDDDGRSMPRMSEKLIMLADDTDFTVEQSEKLAPCLLGLALKYCDNYDYQSSTPILSCIRTGASMLPREKAHDLIPLLYAGHNVKTSLVAVKMVGRIFEAQPPDKINGYTDLVDVIEKIANSLLNPWAIEAPQAAAQAHLAIYALAAMASSKVLTAIEKVIEIDANWFTRSTRRDLLDLQGYWESQDEEVAQGPRELLAKAISIIEKE